MILNALRDIFPRSGWKSFLKGRAKSTAESLLMMPNTLAMGFKPWLPLRGSWCCPSSGATRHLPPQGVKVLAPGQASKIDFPERETASSRLLPSHFVRQPPQRGRRHGIRRDGRSFCIYAVFLSPQCIIVINSVSNRQIFCTSIDFSICTIYTKSVHRLFDESHRSGGPETIQYI